MNQRFNSVGCAVVVLWLCAVAGLAKAQTAPVTKRGIQEAQQHLLDLGYDAGTPDGALGAKTVGALRKFQSQHGLPVTGILDQKTMALLVSAKPSSRANGTASSASAAKANVAKEEADWAVATTNPTPDGYIAFYNLHPNSTKLTVRSGAVKWGHGMHRDPNPPYGYLLDDVTIGSYSLSISPQEAVILGFASDVGGGRIGLNTSGPASDAEAVVIFRDDKIVARKDADNSVRSDIGEFDKAITQGDLAKVRALIKTDPTLVVTKNEKGSTPLHLAAATSQKDISELLIANKADVNAKANDGTTPLHQAAFDGSVEVASVLLANGADVGAKENGGYTPLHAAAVMGRKAVAELLIANRADVNAKANDGTTPLRAALGQHHSDVADVLRQHGGQ
ncbi:MAG: ankyrin repeat domain-containing protein [Bryobacteraceae bacterium]